MLDEVLHDIPIEYRDRYALLFEREDLVPVEVLRRKVQSYLATVKQVASLVTMLDLSEAERLGRAAEGLLSFINDDLSQRLIQTAILYFILEEEDEEVTGVLGFDDDIQVMNAVSRTLGHPELVLELKRRN